MLCCGCGTLSVQLQSLFLAHGVVYAAHGVYKLAQEELVQRAVRYPYAAIRSFYFKLVIEGCFITFNYPDGAYLLVADT